LMFKHAIVALALLNGWGRLSEARAGHVPALDKSEIPSLEAVTAFRAVHDKSRNLFVRLFEADASADVAKNPVALFLVITNDAGGPDLQEHTWRLPSVAQIKNVSLNKSGIQISAIVDGPLNEQTGRLPEHREILNVAYSFAGGRLGDHIEVKISRP
jgi:hypothetical protein